MGEAKRRQRLGSTGRFPDGTIRPGDEGELIFGVSDPDSAGNIHVDFGTPVTWFAMPTEAVINLAKLLLTKAGVKKIELTF